MGWRFRLGVIATLLTVVTGACKAGGNGALSLPPPDGGQTVTEARLDDGGGSWVRGFIVAVRNEPVRLCEALTESDPPQCGGDSLVLGDGILWREPTQETAVIGAVIGGLLTDAVEFGDESAAQPCGYDPDGPCASFPGVLTNEGVWWTDVEYSVIGTIHDDELGRLEQPEGAD